MLLHADGAAVCAVLSEMPLQAAPPAWLAAFRGMEIKLKESSVTLPAEAEVVRAMIDRLPPGATLFSGNSMPIRDIDGFSGSGAKPLRIVANRGASGIDGNVSTALGMAAARQGKVAALLGDLTCCHDIGGLLAARGLDGVLVVLNNGGGGIFGYLPQAGLESFERLWLTPAGLDFGQAAKLYGLEYRRVDSPEEFGPAFSGALEKATVTLIEVTIDREASIACHHAYWRTL
jgi:2-succinyl-5-enolpyruvyl-6-hydroxy-3-cyclohexene-1-carboxylate synthase